MTLRFSDGVSFNTEGPMRIESRHDGLYVVGRGFLIPINTMEEGHSIIQRFNKEPKR